uniref:Uncharacterized protein n=1 Tax=Parascaris equorum TaxID=6256 RepID=A0A914RVF4_PAREQ
MTETPEPESTCRIKLLRPELPSDMQPESTADLKCAVNVKERIEINVILTNVIVCDGKRHNFLLNAPSMEMVEIISVEVQNLHSAGHYIYGSSEFAFSRTFATRL